jgi:hypothetical protein
MRLFGFLIHGGSYPTRLFGFLMQDETFWFLMQDEIFQFSHAE